MRNWKDPEDYSFTKDLKPEGWAWQFLRRDQGYRDFWRRFEVKYEHENGRAPEGAGPFILLDAMQLPLPILNPNEELPPADVLQHFLASPEDHPFYPSPEGGGEIQIDAPEWHAAWLFDLTIPLSPQLKMAKEDLTSIQRDYEVQVRRPKRGLTTQNKDRWTDYLRALDGKESGASNGEIVKVILGESGSLDDPSRRGSQLLRQAREMARSGIPDLTKPHLVWGELDLSVPED